MRSKQLPRESERREAIPLREGIIAVLGGGARAMRSKNSLCRLEPVAPEEGVFRLPHIQEDAAVVSPSPQPPRSTKPSRNKAAECARPVCVEEVGMRCTV